MHPTQNNICTTDPKVERGLALMKQWEDEDRQREIDLRDHGSLSERLAAARPREWVVTRYSTPEDIFGPMRRA